MLLLLLLLLLALLTLLALLSLFALLALFVCIEQRFGHVGFRGHLADGQRDWLLGCAQLDLNGVLLVLRLGLAAQLDKEHIAIGLLARFVTDLKRKREETKTKLVKIDVEIYNRFGIGIPMRIQIRI